MFAQLVKGVKPSVLRWGGLGLFLAALHAGAQDLEEAQKQFRRGQYAEVTQLAQRQVKEGISRYEWRLLLVKTLLTTGRYDEAYTNAVAGLNNHSSEIELRLLARQTALFQNRPEEARQRLNEIRLFLEERPPNYQTPDELVCLGEALLLLGIEPRLVLENCFQRAQKSPSAPREAFLASGQLALDKHDFKLAADVFRAGLEKFADDPDLLAGLAQAYEPGNREQMLACIKSALDTNPRHVPSLLLLANHCIDAEQYDDAEKQLQLVLKVNPHEPEALACCAVLADLKNNTNEEWEFREHALKYYQTNPRVDYLIGTKLSQKYRFAEGSAAQRRALEFEPDYLPAKRQLAEDLLRLGKDAEGWQLAEAVHKQDGYDVTAYNLSTLHGQMTKYQALSNADFIVHMTPHEAGLYGDRVLALLSRARERLSAKYGVALKQPTTVEIFAEQKDFAVRTFGMPGNPGYLGVCFGPVITANSPASQAPNPANWEDVLWHEFCHVITLTATQNRMPRWLSEGISVYEEREANPAWGEKMNLAYRDMILNGELTPLSKLSSAFLAPSNSVHLQFAYYESSLVVEFIVQRHGFDTLKGILADLRDGHEINASLAKRTGNLAETEKQFVEYVQSRAKALAPGADLVKPPPLKSDAEIRAWEAAHPNNFYVQMREAAELIESKKWSDARDVLEKTCQVYHGESRSRSPLWLLSVAQRNLKETNAELATLEKLASREADFVDLYVRLIEISESRQDWPAMLRYANVLLSINPLISLPHQALAKAGDAAGDFNQAIIAWRKLLRLDPADPADAHYQLARLLYQQGGADAEAKRHVLESLEDAPRFRDAQRLLLKINEKMAQPNSGSATSNQ